MKADFRLCCSRRVVRCSSARYQLVVRAGEEGTPPPPPVRGNELEHHWLECKAPGRACITT